MTHDIRLSRGGHFSPPWNNSFLNRFMCYLSHTSTLSLSLPSVMSSGIGRKHFHSSQKSQSNLRSPCKSQMMLSLLKTCHCSDRCCTRVEHTTVRSVRLVCYRNSVVKCCCGLTVLWHHLVGIWEKAGQTSGATTNLEKSLIYSGIPWPGAAAFSLACGIKLVTRKKQNQQTNERINEHEYKKREYSQSAKLHQLRRYNGTNKLLTRGMMTHNCFSHHPLLSSAPW